MGAGEDSGAFAAIQPDTLAPRAPQVPADPGLAALAEEVRAATERMKRAVASGDDVLIIDAIHHQVDLAAALEKAAATDQVRRETWLDGYAAAEAACPVPIPPQRKRGGHRKEHPHLKLLGFLPAPLAAWAAKHAVAVKASAAVIAAVSVPAGALVIHAALAGPVPSAQAFGTGAAPAASIEGAVPIGDPTFIAHVTKPGLDAKSSRKNDPDGAQPGLPPPSAPGASGATGASAASSSAPSSSAPSGPAVLTVSTTAIDLSGGGTGTVTLTASGAGWVSWSVSTTGTDLDFSKTSGVLQAGQSYQLTVSLASQDGNATQVFTVGGQQVTVQLPAPPAAPSPAATVAPSPADSASPAPTAMPA